MPSWEIGMIAFFGWITFMVMGIPFYLIWTYHRRKVEEIRAQRQIQIAEETRAAIQGLREEFNALRDTTTQYDMSFDTAMHRLESRIGNVEKRIGASESVPVQVNRS